MINLLFLLSGCLVAVWMGRLVIPKILLISYKKRLFDLPDARKVHTVPVPRLGGLSFFPVILISWCLMVGLSLLAGYPFVNPSDTGFVSEFLFFAVGCMMLYLVGVTDDLIGVGYRQKFVVQIFAALLLTLPGVWLNTLDGLFGIYALPIYVGVPLTLLVVVYITNAINLIDGIDGLASGLSCIALAFLGTLCVFRAEYVYALLAYSTLGVLVVFWFYNVFGNAQRGHKLFMGDAGSLTLGYILSLLVIHLSNAHPGDSLQFNGDMILAFSTLIVPLFDVVRVVLHRLREGKSPFLPDKNHIHHKLLRTGMRVRTVMASILAMALFFIALNGLLGEWMGVTAMLVTDIVVWILLQLGINAAIRKREREKALSTHVNP